MIFLFAITCRFFHLPKHLEKVVNLSANLPYSFKRLSAVTQFNFVVDYMHQL